MDRFNVRRLAVIRRLLLLSMAAVLVYSSVALAQVRTGAIEGKVADESGAMMPGVAVTLSGEAVLGTPTTITVSDGSYRFRALAPGTYNITFQLSGFADFHREGILIAGARTITVNVSLSLAGVAETVTVTGESPLIDLKQTVIGATFDDALKQDIPGATDTWALLGQTMGVRMRGYDVGGSHKSQQTSSLPLPSMPIHLRRRACISRRRPQGPVSRH